MIDTIRVSYNLTLSEAEIANVLWNDRFQKEYFDNGKNYHSYGYYKGNSEPRLRYYPNRQELSIEVSVPTLLYGSNIYDYQLQDAHRFISTLSEYVSNALKIDQSRLEGIEKAEVKRLDVCRHFKADDPLMCYIDYFCKQRISQYSCEVKYNGNAVFWIAETRKIKIYIKVAHMKYLMKEGKMFFTDQEFGLMENILKLEVTLSSDDLYNLHPARHLLEVLSSPLIECLLIRDAKRIGLYENMNIHSRTKLLDQIHRQPESILTKADKQKAIHMLEIYNTYGLEAINEHYSSSVLVKLKKKLRSIGLNQMGYSTVKLQKLTPVIINKERGINELYDSNHKDVHDIRNVNLTSLVTLVPEGLLKSFDIRTDVISKILDAGSLLENASSNKITRSLQHRSLNSVLNKENYVVC